MEEEKTTEKDIKKLASNLDSVKPSKTTFNKKDRMDYFSKRVENASVLPEKLLNEIQKEIVGKVLGIYKIYIINGDLIRTKVDIDFVDGGNPARYRYVPENRIWIDEHMHPNDAAAVVIHEFVEYIIMKYKGKSYDHSHDRASAVELKFRKKHYKEENQTLESELKKANKFIIEFLKKK